MCTDNLMALESAKPFSHFTLRVAGWRRDEVSRLLHGAANSRTIEVGIDDLRRFDHENGSVIEIDIMPTSGFSSSNLPFELGRLVESVRLAS
jgi:hypothetical protein